jgi:histone H3/H4
MISEGLPPGLRMGNDVKEMIVECCNEFIQTISSEANEISTKENKTTILPEHVVAALESLDFASMVETVKATMNEGGSGGEEEEERVADQRRGGTSAATGDVRGGES